MLRRRADQPDRGPRGAAHRPARAARRSGRARPTTCMPCSTRCWPTPRRCATTRQRHPPRRQHRHRRQRPRPADGGAGARRLRRPGQRFHFVSNVDGHDIAPVLRRLRSASTRCSSSPARPSRPRRRWPTRTPRKRLVPGARRQRHRRATSSRPPPTSRPRAAFGITHHLRLLGLGRRPLFAVVGDRPADRHRRSAPTSFRALLAGAHAMDRHFASAPLGAEPAGAAGAARRLVPQLPRLRQPLRRALSPGPAAPAGLPAAAGDGKQRQARRPRRRSRCHMPPARWCGASPAPTASTPTSRCCTRARDVIPVEFIAVQAARPTVWPTSTPCCWPTAWRRARR